MKFKFCAGADCPLWALSSLHAAATLPAPLFAQLVQHVAEETDEDHILEILKDTPLSSRDDGARAAAALRWVLRGAWRAGCTGAQLSRELQLLGAPRQHAAALASAADAHRHRYVEAVRENRFLVNRVTDASTSAAPTGSIDAVKLSLDTDDCFTRRRYVHDLLLREDQAKQLISQLKSARHKMEEIEQLTL